MSELGISDEMKNLMVVQEDQIKIIDKPVERIIINRLKQLSEYEQVQIEALDHNLWISTPLGKFVNSVKTKKENLQKKSKLNNYFLITL